jgi:ribosomal protein L7Ae-like RNA K-turn-binding protein
MKVYIAAPGQHNWPTVPDDIQDRLLTILTEYFNGHDLKRTRKKKIINPIKQQFAIGLRCVMRCLKQKQCVLVLVCTTLTPIILTKPILLLSQMNSIPAIRLKNLSTLLTKTFAIPHCSTIGLKLSCDENLVKNLLDSCEKQQQQQPSSSLVKFLPGKVIEPYQNPKRVSAGIKKKKKKK